MQTRVVEIVFNSFLKKFDHFINSWEIGFRNQFVVSLYTRNYKEFDMFLNAGYEVPMVILVTDGAAQMLSKDDFFFMLLPMGGVYGDFNVAFKAKSLASIKAPAVPEGINLKRKPDEDVYTTKTMNCEAEVFADLMELYPDTAVNVKMRALEKREVLLYYLAKERKR
jgi:hypothetical protein